MSSFNETPDIMNVREIIEFAFGDYEGNTVNFKLVKTILYLLARHVRLLERRVEVELGPLTRICPSSSSTLSVTEVKIHAMQNKKRKIKDKGDKSAHGINAHTGGAKPGAGGKGKTPTAKDQATHRSSSKRGGTQAPTSRGSKESRTYQDILSAMEEQKERELRIIHQRADSFEETTNSPTPMASVGSMQAQYEKILVVERGLTIEAGESESVEGQKRAPRISVVTQEQFEAVVQAVRELQNKLLPVGTPRFPEQAELMEELRRGASLTDAMAALQLSARLEATEKALVQMIGMVTELAKQTGVELDSETQGLLEARGIIFEDSGTTEADDDGGATEGGDSSVGGDTSLDPMASGSARGASKGGRSSKSGKSTKGGGTSASSSVKSQGSSRKSGKAKTKKSGKKKSKKSREDSKKTGEPVDEPVKPNYITYEDLDAATKDMHDTIINKLTSITTRSNASAEAAYKLSMNLDTKIEAALANSSRMMDLEVLVKQYTEDINTLDTGLSSQMTNYQDQLTQMQHDLEMGLETMAEVLGNTGGGDTVAVAELHSHFANLQMDLDNMIYRQKDLKDAHGAIAYDLETLWKQLEMLRDTKSDREEVIDALRDKAGIGDLNGFISLQQFDAVRNDLEKRIAAAYDKFNNQELIWQKAIDEIVRSLGEKADLILVESLKNEINKYLNIMKDRMQYLVDIVGEPKSAMLSKKLFRNTHCLSCGNPAHMDKEEPVSIPALPKFSARRPGEGAESESKSKGGGDHRICYTDFPIPHPKDPRSHICQRYCGGSHTLINERPSRAPPAIVIQQDLRPINTELGTDGNMYLVEEQKIPCLPCNMPKPAADIPKPQSDKQASTKSNETQPFEDGKQKDNVSTTPPAHEMAIID